MLFGWVKFSCEYCKNRKSSEMNKTAFHWFLCGIKEERKKDSCRY